HGVGMDRGTERVRVEITQHDEEVTMRDASAGGRGEVEGELRVDLVAAPRPAELVALDLPRQGWALRAPQGLGHDTGRNRGRPGIRRRDRSERHERDRRGDERVDSESFQDSLLKMSHSLTPTQ